MTGTTVDERGDLSVSIVAFRPDLTVLRTTLASFARAAERARECGRLGQAVVWIIDNGTDDAAALDRLTADALAPYSGWLRLETLRGHGNIGYGRGHNLAISRAASRYHVVLNPDVVTDEAALVEAIAHLEAHPEVGMVAPRAVGTSGARQYLCKRYPTVAILGLRGFAPRWLRRRFQHRLDRYEMRDLADDVSFSPVPIASGCFMVCRTAILAGVGGFAPHFFLYFEDFDLSLRFGRHAQIAYVPAVRIVHAGGDAAGKGWAHRRMFIRSAVLFFRRHGWRLL